MLAQPAATVTATATATTALVGGGGSGSRLAVMTRLAASLPENDLGMPMFIYRPDAIPENFDSLSPTQQSQIQGAATVRLSFSEGFPTTPGGTLFWEQLEFEGGSEFLFFQSYLGMLETHGFRSIQILARENAERSMKVAHPQQGPVDQLAEHQRFTSLYEATLYHFNELLTYHYWPQRARAYDLVGQAAYRRIRNQRAMLLDNHHYQMLSGMMAKCVARFGRFTDEEMDAMNPLETVKMIKEVVGMQRVAVGLPANAPSEDHLPGAQQGMEVHLRTIAKSNQQERRSDAATLLENEETAGMAQELIVKMIQSRRTAA